MDNIKNFGGATLAAGIAAGDTSASVISGQGARLESTGSWSAVIWNVTDYGNDVDAAYWAGQAELVRVTRTGDSLTLVRAQEGTVARNFNAVGKSYRIKQTLSAYVFAQKADAANGVHTGITQVDTLRVLGRTITPVAVMSGTVVDVASVNNYKALSTNTTFTWSAVPATDSWFGGRYRNTSGSPITVSFPTCWSQNLGQDISSFVLQPGQRATIRFYYDGTDTEIHADPITVAQAKAALNLQQSDISGLVSALSGKAASSHTHTASETTDFASAARAQVEAMLTAGSGMTLTPSGSGASRSLALISSGGGGGAFEGQIALFLRADAATSPVGWAEVTTVADYEELMFLRYDSVAPTVTGVSSSKTNGSYTAGEVIDIEVTFSKAVVVTGTPQLTINVGSSYAVDYLSGTGTATLTFRYTVQSGHTSADLDYASTSALALNGGTIKSLAKVNATLTLAAPGASGSLGNAKALVITSGAGAPAFDREDQRSAFLSSGATDNITVATTIAVGKRAVLLIRTQTGIGVTSVSDSAGNTWTIDESYTRTSQSEYAIASAHVGTVLTGGSSTITITWGASSYSHKDFALWQLSGVASTSAKDSSAEGESFGSSVSTSVTTVATNTCVVGFTGAGGAPTYTPATFSLQGAAVDTGDGTRLHFLRLDASSAGAKSPAGSFGGSVGWGAILVAYKA